IPLRTSPIDIHPNARWKQNGLTVAGGHGPGNGINQLANGYDLYVDDDQTVYVADQSNHRIVEWKSGATSGQVEKRSSQTSIDRDHSVYVSEYRNHRVMKWMEGAKQGIVVAGGQGQGNSLTQFSYPGAVVVDQLGTIYVADDRNDRIMRWLKGATHGSVIVGGNGGGKESNRLCGPISLSFDRHGNLYVVDLRNHRVKKFNIDSNS
ncbi:unnamed protein product, partial [Rotaria socialis]